MKQDNRGMTLIELIIAVSMAAIILGAVTLFIRNALRSYETANDTIDLQMESHVMMEQLGSWIMEGNRIEVVEQSNITTVGVDSDVLVIYQIPRTSDIGHLPDNLKRDNDGKLVNSTEDFTPTATKRLVWVQDNSLYMAVVTGITNFDGDTTMVLPAVSKEGNCVCLYMDTFEPQWDEDLGTVKISVMLQAGVQEYSLTNEFKVRNEIVSAPSPSPSTGP